MLRSGMSWKLNETIIELWHSSYDAKTPTSRSYSEILDNDDEDGARREEEEEEEEILNIDANRNERILIDSGDNCCRKRISSQIIDDNEEGTDDDDDDENGSRTTDNECEAFNDDGGHRKQIGNGAKELDSFLMTCEERRKAKAVASSVVWQI